MEKANEAKKTPKTTTRALLQASLDELRGIRDEIRVRLHLGGMDAKDAFHDVERELDSLGHELTVAGDETLEKAAEGLEKLAKSLRALRSKVEHKA